MIPTEWSEASRRDRLIYLDWYAEYSTASAERMARKLLSQTRLLSRFPRLGHLTSSAETYHLPIAGTPLLIVYRIEQDRILILRILHSAQDWPGRF